MFMSSWKNCGGNFIGMVIYIINALSHKPCYSTFYIPQIQAGLAEYKTHWRGPGLITLSLHPAQQNKVALIA